MSASFFLFPNLIEDNGEVADNTVETTKDTCDKHFPRRDLGEFVDTGDIEEFALNKTGFDIEAFFYSLGIFCNNPSSRSCVFFRHSESGSSIQMFCQISIISAFHCKTDDGVFVYAVINASFPKLFTELGIICDIDAFVIDQNTGDSLFKLCFEFCDGLLFFQ